MVKHSSAECFLCKKDGASVSDLLPQAFCRSILINVNKEDILNLKYKEISNTDENGYSYITVENDDNNVRIYTLKNGLQVYLAQNFDAPRIQTYIPVRTGSNNDPADNTGLAHYLEHMMFKGTSKIGTLDWESESILLDEIAELYEQHKAEIDSGRKREIYKKIDEVSQRASKFEI